tara:strand:- start:1747 stop:1950 length:204 start_codon:yes stop_codon:yes gene_type:complete
MIVRKPIKYQEITPLIGKIWMCILFVFVIVVEIIDGTKKPYEKVFGLKVKTKFDVDVFSSKNCVFAD